MSTKNRVFTTVGIMVAVCAGYAGYLLSINQTAADVPPPPIATLPEVNQQALSYWSFEDLDGQQRHMSEWSGKLVVVNFWATWCSPCRKEIPGFVALQNAYPNGEVQFIGIALDRVAAVREFAAEHNINYPLLIGEDNVAEYMRALGNTIGALPYSVLVAPDGRVLETHQGEWHQAAVDKLIRAAL